MSTEFEKLIINLCNIKDSLNSDDYKQLNQIIESKLIQSNKTSKNKGEKDEILCIKQLFTYSENNDISSLIKIFGEDADEGIILINPENQNTYSNINEINNTKSLYKCDIIMKLIKTNTIYNISIKSKSCGNPSILNHTPRSAFVFQHGCLNKDLKNIDKFIKKINKMRKKEIVGEDIKLENLILSKNIKKSLKNVLKYFIFEGTGRGNSKINSNSILIYDNDDIDNIKFYDCITNDNKNKYIDTIFNNCIISLRDKGMSKNNLELCKPWIYKDIKKDGSIKLKGSLHIRIKIFQ